jgi:hypothetical protein
VHGSLLADVVCGVQSFRVVQADNGPTFLHHGILHRAVVPDSVHEKAVILASVQPPESDGLWRSQPLRVVTIQTCCRLVRILLLRPPKDWVGGHRTHPCLLPEQVSPLRTRALVEGQAIAPCVTGDVRVQISWIRAPLKDRSPLVRSEVGAQSSIAKSAGHVRLDIDGVLHNGVCIQSDGDGADSRLHMLDGPNTLGIACTWEFISTGIRDNNLGVGQESAIDRIINSALNAVGDWHARLWEWGVLSILAGHRPHGGGVLHAV